MVKKVFSVIIVLSCVLFAGVVFAEKYVYPTDNPILSFEMPDDWKIKLGDNGLTAVPPDESIFLILEIEEGKSLDELAEMIDTFLEEFLTEFEVEESGTIERNGIVMTYNDGPAFIKENEVEVYVSLNYFTPDTETGCFILYFGNPDTPEDRWDEVNDILDSVQAE